jgi:putative ABC transport system permease protein
LSLFGGAVGVILGLGLAAAASTGMSIPFVLDPSIVLISFGFSGLIGVVFGYFPARRAAQLNPIEALRHE